MASASPLLAMKRWNVDADRPHRLWSPPLPRDGQSLARYSRRHGLRVTIPPVLAAIALGEEARGSIRRGQGPRAVGAVAPAGGRAGDAESDQGGQGHGGRVRGEDRAVHGVRPGDGPPQPGQRPERRGAEAAGRRGRAGDEASAAPGPRGDAGRAGEARHQRRRASRRRPATPPTPRAPPPRPHPRPSPRPRSSRTSSPMPGTRATAGSCSLSGDPSGTARRSTGGRTGACRSPSACSTTRSRTSCSSNSCTGGGLFCGGSRITTDVEPRRRWGGGASRRMPGRGRPPVPPRPPPRARTRRGQRPTRGPRAGARGR